MTTFHPSNSLSKIVEKSTMLASVVIDTFGKEIMMIPDGDHFITTQKIDVNAAFFAWMASFGGGAEILGPDKVVERMKKFLDNAAKVYKKDGET